MMCHLRKELKIMLPANRQNTYSVKNTQNYRPECLYRRNRFHQSTIRGLEELQESTELFRRNIFDRPEIQLLSSTNDKTLLIPSHEWFLGVDFCMSLFSRFSLT